MAVAMADNCISCGVRGDARIMKELGPPLHRMERGEAHLLDGGFGGRLGSITWQGVWAATTTFGEEAGV